MSMKKKALAAASYVMVAALAIGGTVAYLQDQESAMNVLTVGDAVDIAINEYQRNDDASALEDFEQGKALYPIVGSAQATANSDNMDKWGMPKAKNYGDKIVTIENTGDADAYVRVYIAKPLALSDLAKDGSKNTSDDALHMNLGNRVNTAGEYTDAYGDAWPTDWGWDYNVDVFEAEIKGEKYEVCTFVTKEKLPAHTESTAVIAGVYLDSSIDYDDGVYTMGNYVIDYDLSKGVTIPVFAEAVSEKDAFGGAVETFKKWADTVTGGVVAQPANKAVRPTAYLPDPAGEAINGLVVVDDSDDETNLRALYNGEKKSDYMTKDLTISDSYLEGTYAMNAYAVDGSGAKLVVSDTTLKGWVSYTGFASASFTSCTFDKNSNAEVQKTIRPYDTTVFTNCDFAADYVFLWDKLGADDTVTFVNCTIGGVAITEASQVNGTDAAVTVK